MPRFGDLGQRVLRAGGWNMAQIVAMTGARLASNLIMTRLLMPEAFGMMALVSALLNAYMLFSNIGISRSIVRDPDGEEPHYLQVAWTVKVLRGGMIAALVLVSAGLLWLLAPGLAPEDTIYADPRLPGLIALSALAPLMDGAFSTTRQLAVRRLENWRFVITAIFAQGSGIAAQITFASLWPTVWALMFGMLTINLVGLILSHTVFPGPRMRIAWDREIVDRLWQFGKFIMGGSAFTFVGQNADKFILASLLDATAFGLYSIATIWVSAGRQLIGQLGGRVGFPAMSEVIRERPKEVPRLFGRFQRVIDALCLAAFAFCLLLGPWFIGLLYTDTYATAGLYLQLMGLAYLVARFNTMNELVMNTGNTRALMWIAAVRAVTICIFLPVGYYLLGVEGAILAVALNQLVTAPYTIHLLRPVLGAARARRDVLWVAGTLSAAVAVYTLT